MWYTGLDQYVLFNYNVDNVFHQQWMMIVASWCPCYFEDGILLRIVRGRVDGNTKLMSRSVLERNTSCTNNMVCG